MIVIPAIDLMGGQVVRLKKGDPASKTVYSSDPAEVAQRFARAGAKLVHVVDLDGALAGRPVNEEAIRAIAEVRVDVELGGGLRSLADVERVLGYGVHAVILGTAAVGRLDLVKDACREFPGRVRAAIDAKDGQVAVAGWAQGTGLSALEVARRVRDAGVQLVQYTDVARDGMFTGVDAAGAAVLQRDAGVAVVASGGVATLEDVRACARADLWGVIVGKAIYEKRIDLAEAIAAAGETRS
jgi:phosphoribosylformimino-5-aminoimidazole carboxamide ribotide isomerase